MLEEEDELTFNYFFLLLKTEFKRKYQQAMDNGWTICVPVGTAMRGCPITGYFIDQQILRPTRSPIHFISSYPRERYLYKIEKRLITCMGRAKTNPIDVNEEQSTVEEETIEDMIKYNVDPETDNTLIRILSIEKGYNKQHKPYTILLVDNPLIISYRNDPENNIVLTAVVDSYKNATDFLEMLSKRNILCISQADDILANLKGCHYPNIEDMKNVVKSFIQSNWAEAIRKSNFQHQRDERYQKRLSLALEIYVLHGLHKLIYDKISEDFKEPNSYLKEKIDALNAAGATPDQLGVREGFAIMLAHGVVELARLGATVGPHARLSCLKSSLDMAIAEIKGAVAESISKNDIDDEATLNMTIMPGDLIQICTYLIVKCKCYTLYQDLYYIDTFVFSLNPADKTGYILTVYKSALENLKQIDAKNLPPRSEKVKTEIGLEDLMTFVMKEPPRELSPLDINLKNLTSMIKKSTILKSEDDSFSEEDF